MLRSLVDALVRTDGCTVLLSTHLLADVERLATHVGILDRGRISGGRSGGGLAADHAAGSGGVSGRRGSGRTGRNITAP